MGGEALTARVKDFVRAQGAELVGVAPVERFEGAPQGRRPRDYLPQARSVVVAAYRLLDPLVEGLPDSRPRYTENYHVVNDELILCANRTARLLVQEGFASVPIYYRLYEWRIPNPAPFFGEMSFRHAAQEAGLGQIGLSQLLITPQFGPRVRLMMVLTSAALVPDPKTEGKLCDGERCRYRCVQYCPAQAIKPEGSLDKEACSRYRLETLHPLRCGMCVASCPVTLRPLRRAGSPVMHNWRPPRGG